jgi:hypothetical protein
MSDKLTAAVRSEVEGLVQRASTRGIADAVFFNTIDTDREPERSGDLFMRVAACLASLARAGEAHVSRRINRRGRLPTCMWLPGRAP